MEIRPPTSAITAAVAPSADIGKLMTTWRTGQVLDATIVAKPSANTVTLTINNVPITATADVPEQWIGTSVKLAVTALTPTVILKILPSATNLADVSPLSQALREQLPRQLPLPPLLANLQLISQHSKAFATLLPEGVQQAIKQLFNSLPNSHELTRGTGLARALRDSGQTFEQKLATAAAAQAGTPPAVTTDLKRGLLQLNEALQRDTPSAAKTTSPADAQTLSKDAAGAIARAAQNLTLPTATSTRVATPAALPTPATQDTRATPRAVADVELAAKNESNFRKTINYSGTRN